MQKSMFEISMNINDKQQRFSCESTTTTEEVKTFIFELSKYIGQIEDIAKAKEAEAKKESEKIEHIQVENGIETNPI